MATGAPIAIFAVISLIGLLCGQSKAKESEGVTDFGAPLAMRILSMAMPGGFLLWFFVDLLRNPFDYLTLLLLFLGILGLFGIPADITMTPEGVREKFWWRRERTIFWKDVESINYKTASGSIRIRDVHGTKITHSKMNRDPLAFEIACMKYTTLARRELHRKRRRAK